MLTLACCSLRRFDLLARMIASAESGTRPPDRYILLSNGGTLTHAWRTGQFAAAMAVRSPLTEVRELGRTSVAAAWNKAFQLGQGDYTVVTGDDVVFGKDTLRGLVAEADAHPEALFVYPRVMESQMFCVFLARQELFRRIGYFDERFFPAYFEDNDFCRRMRLAGIEPRAVDCDGYLHDVSSTLKSFSGKEMEEHHAQFRENQRKYVAKWGGLPGQEIYDQPRT